MNMIESAIRMENIAKLRALPLMPTSSTAHFVEMTPDLAASILEHNNNDNRNISAANVNHIAMQIADNCFKENPQPIVFSICGRLLNGQHRLMAIVKAGISTKIAIVLDCDPAVYEVMDIGNKRSLADVSGIHQQTVACIKLLIEIARFGREKVSVDHAKQYAIHVQRAEHEGNILQYQSKRLPCAIRAAYVASWLGNVKNREYCQNSLKFLLDNDGTAPVIHLTFFRTLELNRKAYHRGAAGRREFFNAALNLFDPECSEHKRLRKYQLAQILAPIMDIFEG